jgi:putative acetyltransferase
MRIEPDDLSRPEIHALLREHHLNLRELSPPESIHALDLHQLRHPSITFFSAWDGATLLGFAALKELSPTHGELKSMRTPAANRRRGAARALLAHIISVATCRGYTTLSLETGSGPAFTPAQTLYTSFGFQPCPPFAPYTADPNSLFFSLPLQPPNGDLSP